MSDNKKNDLTKLFDLSDFEHEDDPEADAYFEKKAKEEIKSQFDLDESSSSENSDSDEEDDPFSQTQVNFNPSEILDNDVEENSEAEIEEDNAFFDGEEEAEAFNFDEAEPSDDFSDNDYQSNDSFFETQEELTHQDESEEDNLEHEVHLDESESKEDDEEQDISPQRVDDILEASSIAASALKVLETSEEVVPTVNKYENFEDVSSFAQNSTYGDIKSKSNPPFSMIISDIKYLEDSHSIFSILKEFGFISRENHDILKKSLERGSAIISRVSEFAIIFLYHKLYTFDVNLKVGPSDLIFKNQSQLLSETGLTDSEHILQNKEDSLNLNKKERDSILFSKSQTIEGYHIKDFLGYTDETTIIQIYPQAGKLEQSHEDLEKRELFKQEKEKLIKLLQEQLLKKGANAALEFNTIITPLFTEGNETFEYEIKLECNAVWIEKNQGH